MATLREWRCAFHGPFESRSSKCDGCGSAQYVVQEIRTAPAYRRKNMKFIDSTLRGIADDNGLTDLRNDPKAGLSVLQCLQNKKNLQDMEKPRWGNLVPHAQPGFSHNPELKVPTVSAESMGFAPTSAAQMDFPPPRTKIVGRYSG